MTTRLAVQLGAPVVPIAVTSARCWPRRSFVLRPGTIDVSIGRPIPSTGRQADELMRRIRLDLPIELGEDSLGVGSTDETPTPTPEPGELGETPAASETPLPTEDPDVSASPTPTPTDALEGVVGQDASQESCVVPYGGL